MLPGKSWYPYSNFSTGGPSWDSRHGDKIQLLANKNGMQPTFKGTNQLIFLQSQPAQKLECTRPLDRTPHLLSGIPFFLSLWEGLFLQRHPNPKKNSATPRSVFSPLRTGLGPEAEDEAWRLRKRSVQFGRIERWFFRFGPYGWLVFYCFLD